MDRRAEQEYKQALDSLRFSSEGKERIMKNLMENQGQRSEKRKGIRPLRASLIAACLCLALVGTAFAAAAVYRVTVWHYADKESAGYHVSGEIARYSMEQFSPELRAACQSWGYDPAVPGSQFPVERGTKSRGEAQAFLGKAVPLIWPDIQLFPDRGAGFILWQNLDSRELEYIYIRMSYEPVDGLYYLTEIGVYPEAYPTGVPYLSGGLRTKPGSGYVFEQLGEYVTVNGHTAELVAYHNENSPRLVTCSGYFIRSGILYQVSVDSTPSNPQEHAYTQEEVLDHLYRLLDSFPA